MCLDDLEHIVESDAEATSCLFGILLVLGGTFISVEDGFQLAFGDADTLVIYLNIYMLLILEGGNLNVDFVLLVFGGVIYHVADGFLQIFLVCRDGGASDMSGNVDGFG